MRHPTSVNVNSLRTRCHRALLCCPMSGKTPPKTADALGRIIPLAS